MKVRKSVTYAVMNFTFNDLETNSYRKVDGNSRFKLLRYSRERNLANEYFN